MKQTILSIYYFFSRYANPAERRVGKFFQRVNEKDAPHKVEKALTALVQHNLAVVNLWTEHRYKGYAYLTKQKRKELYEHLSAIQADFARFEQTQHVDTKKLLAQIAHKGVDTAKLSTKQEKLAYMASIMRYLSPQNNRYRYRASSSFGRLLQDPTKDVLEGDCNQIVTLYIALYGARYDVTDLKLTLYPGHVALHFAGVDVETTSATFATYKKEGQTTAPIHEIVSVNLLDTTDIHYKTAAVTPRVLLESARLAYAVSSHRALVKKNLEVAYHNTVRQLLKEHRHKQALQYARVSKSYELIELSAQNGASYALGQKDFATARKFAAASTKKQSLLKTIDHNEAASLYNKKQYMAAEKLFRKMGDHDMIQQCYRGLYVQAQSSLGSLKTVDDIKAHAATVRKMDHYAKKSGDVQLQQHSKKLTKYL